VSEDDRTPDAVLDHPAAGTPAGPEHSPAAVPAGLERPAAAVPGGPAQPAAPGSTRLALVVGGLIIALLAGFAIGRTLDTGTAAGGATGGTPVGVADAAGSAAHEHGAGDDSAAGLSLSAAGWSLAPVSATFTAGQPQDFRFRILDRWGRPATDFAVVHEKPLHLIVVRRDLAGFQHLHPEMAADGTWSVPLTLPAAGSWRAYADFSVVGTDGAQTALTLGVDLAVAGEYAPQALPAAAREVAVDGFTVGYAGVPQAGITAPLQFQISRGGEPVTVEPYLGAYGHLVGIREGDLGYLHVHPDENQAKGEIKFWLSVPSAGRYRFFLDFQVDGLVRTAEFTVDVT